MSRKVIDWLSTQLASADLFGGKSELSVGSSSTYKTKIGGLLSLGALSFVLWFAYGTILTIFDQENPFVLITRSNEPVNTFFHLEQDQMLPVIALYDTKTRSVASLEVFGSTASITASHSKSFFDFSKLAITVDATMISVKQCALLENKEPYEWMFTSQTFKQISKDFMCLDVPRGFKVLIKGTRFTDAFNSLAIDILPCSLADQSKCLSEQQLRRYNIILITLQKYVDFKNYPAPVKFAYTSREEVNFLRDKQTVLYSYLKSTRIQNSKNWFQRAHEEKSFTDVHREEVSSAERDPQSVCTKKQIEDSSCQPYIRIEYRSSGILDTCVRTYTDVFDAVSNIGGFKELVFMGVVVVYTFYNDFFMNERCQ